MQVLAVHPSWADSPCKKQAEITSWRFICFRISRVRGNDAPRGRGSLAEIFVFAVAPRPFVVPYVEDGTSRYWRFSFERCRVDLWAGRASLAPYYFLDFFAFSIGPYESGFGGGGHEGCGYSRGFRCRIDGGRCHDRRRGLNFGHDGWKWLAWE